MIAMWFAFIFGCALALGSAYFMLRTMSMLKAGVALMACAVGATLVLFILHADVVATMTIMMFGPAMLGMILFMLMLMEDSGGFMMTSSDVAAPEGAADVEPAVMRAGAEMLGPISEISPAPDSMDMAMTNSQGRWAGPLAVAFFVANAAVVVMTPFGGVAAMPSPSQAFLVGTALLEKYMVVFEGCGFLILLAVIVATMAGRRTRT
ncbi:MAG: hypothetical protein NVSMB19_21410 [Vulcanimicrobiaceae bacterium]